MPQYRVVFLPNNRTINVNDNENLFDAAIKAGISLKSSCGGVGTCGRCRVTIKSGRAKLSGVGRLTKQQLSEGDVLACQAYPQSDMEIEVPDSSILREHQVLTMEGKGLERPDMKFEPLFQKVQLELTQPTLDDHIDDVSRLFNMLRTKGKTGDLRIGLEIIQKLPHIIREKEWRVTVSLADFKEYMEIIDIEPGWDYRMYYGLAVDIGTTTVAVHLINLDNGESLGMEGTYNKQAVFGDDVISRIIYAVEHEKGLQQLQSSIVTTINALIKLVTKNKNIDFEDIWYVTCAGNTTMTHLLLGVEPEYIRLEPYVPAFNFINPVRALDLGLKANPKAVVYCLPGIASYVGGDITAGAGVIAIDKQEKLTLFIDVGTNGEMVLGNKEWLVACACSAGPSFEGGGITYGMRAMNGAIEHIKVKPDNLELYWETVGNKKPLGICGSGLIDSLAALREIGVIDRAGNFLPFSSKDKVQIIDGEKTYMLVSATESGAGKDITISESDVKNLIRSKAAIFAGVQTMLKIMSVPLESIEQVYIAGGFGKYINLADAIKIGMFPDLPLEKYIYIGNSSLMGAKMVLLSKDAREEVEKLAEKITYLELSIGNEFMEEFVSALFIPHTNINLFPSVKV